MEDSEEQFEVEECNKDVQENEGITTEQINTGDQFNDAENGENEHYEQQGQGDAAPAESSPSQEVPADGDESEKPGQKINASRDSEDERFLQPGLSVLDRKIFVGGLSWETTVQDVKDYFTKYGTVVDCTLKTDPNTGKSRGFAFVLFEESSSVEKVFSESAHMLNGRKIDPKKALARGGRDPIKKVFVGGLPPDFPLEDIKEYFGKFGKIVEVEQPFDRAKNQRRAFIFITYESEEIVEQVIANPKQTVGGKEVDVRKATPKTEDSAGRGRGAFSNPTRGRGYGPEGWGPFPGPYPPPGYDYYSGYYGAGYGAYPPGYDYSSYYDYSAYYSQPPADWSSYTAAGYMPPYTGYDYSSWYGTDQSGAQQQAASQAGKVKRGTGTAPYHPYSR